MCMFTYTFTNLNTNACDQKKLMLKIFLSTCNFSLWISVLFPWHVFHIVIYVSVRGVSVAVNEIFVHMTHIYPTDGYMPLQWEKFHNLLVSYQQRHRGGVTMFMLHIFFS